MVKNKTPSSLLAFICDTTVKHTYCEISEREKPLCVIMIFCQQLCNINVTSGGLLSNAYEDNKGITCIHVQVGVDSPLTMLFALSVGECRSQGQ